MRAWMTSSTSKSIGMSKPPTLPTQQSCCHLTSQDLCHRREIETDDNQLPALVKPYMRTSSKLSVEQLTKFLQLKLQLDPNSTVLPGRQAGRSGRQAGRIGTQAGRHRRNADANAGATADDDAGTGTDTDTQPHMHMHGTRAHGVCDQPMPFTTDSFSADGCVLVHVRFFLCVFACESRSQLHMTCNGKKLEPALELKDVKAHYWEEPHRLLQIL